MRMVNVSWGWGWVEIPVEWRVVAESVQFTFGVEDSKSVW